MNTDAPAKPAAEQQQPQPPKPMKPSTLKGVEAFLSKQITGSAEPVKKPAPFKPKVLKEEKKVEEPAKPLPVQTPAPALTAADIAAAAAEGVAKAIKPKEEDAPAKPEPKPLSEGDQKKVRVLQKMEALYGEKYKGIAERYAESIRSLADYAAQWEAKHPGQTFDEEDAEHEAFFKQHDVDWADDEYDEARITLAAERVAEDKLEPTKKELEQLRSKERLRESQQAIKSSQDQAARDFWEKLGDDFKGIVDEHGSVNIERLEAMRAADPEGYAIRVGAAQALDVEVAEIHKLYNGLVPHDPKNNPVHQNIAKFVSAMEENLSKRPVQERLDEKGRDFLPAVKYWNLTKAEREKHWTFSEADVKTMRVANLTKAVSAYVEDSEKAHIAWAKARGYIQEEPAQPAAGAGEGAPVKLPGLDDIEDQREPGNRSKPMSPSDVGGPKVAANRGAGQQSSKSSVSTFANRFLGV